MGRVGLASPPIYRMLSWLDSYVKTRETETNVPTEVRERQLMLTSAVTCMLFGQINVSLCMEISNVNLRYVLQLNYITLFESNLSPIY